MGVLSSVVIESLLVSLVPLVTMMGPLFKDVDMAFAVALEASDHTLEDSSFSASRASH